MASTETTANEPRELRTDVPFEDVEFRALYKKTRYVVRTADGWHLYVTRYRPIKQTFHQPLFMEPMLLVHGFSQNRHTWTAGQFVKHLLYFGIDVHILELRGHGRSSIEFQRERAQKTGKAEPADLEYGWDIDSYFLYDVPAGVAGVRRVTKRDRIFYCGHSMGGILGYGYAGIHEHFEGIVTIGAPADMGAGFWPLRALAVAGPSLSVAVDVGLGAVNAQRKIRDAMKTIIAKAMKSNEPVTAQDELEFTHIPFDRWLDKAADLLAYADERPWLYWLASQVNLLARQDRASSADTQWYLREGGENEPRGVVEEFLKWTRRRQMVCYRTGYDFQRGFQKIRVPMAIVFGDLDPLASSHSTHSVYRDAKSEYLLWRPVKGNSHVELTIGHDIKQICFDIKNLIEYAKAQRKKAPKKPKVPPPATPL